MATASVHMQLFGEALRRARHVVVLTGAGVSAESGVPTFRGEGGLWRRYQALELATPEAFRSDPALVWQFYEYRRRLVSGCMPNAAHHAITQLQAALPEATGGRVTVVTQNVDGLHTAAGTQDVIEMHGSLWKVKPVGWHGFRLHPGKVWEERAVPIVPALTEAVCGKGVDAGAAIPLDALPRHPETDELLRPAVVWFGEGLDDHVVHEYSSALATCDLLVVVGTSGTVYPAAGFADAVQARGGAVAEFNLDLGGSGARRPLSFEGKAAELLPAAFDLRSA
eukprot:TRINITY_DN8214_c0_g3_i1.p3 TRINITY_DN8214_c0_g3~~TRINITY_DN8214_c0_g3_i1.p3  ORF type:complete len:281 (+),score=89.78 TRINITY_DN8214_c0_g3_i1:1427-2269(+)